MEESTKYIAFLRGINVGGHHKVPMADLKAEMTALGFLEVETLLNSGNVVFRGPVKEEALLEESIAKRLESTFGFIIPVRVRKGKDILKLYSYNPFKEVESTNDIRLYISFLKLHPQEIELPWISEDHSFRIIRVENRIVCSVLDLSGMKTTKGMEALEKIFGKNITTRNWNTVEKIVEKINNDKAGLRDPNRFRICQ